MRTHFGKHARRLSSAVTFVGLLTAAVPASAVVQSTCPAPCTKPPKTTISVRETAGVLGGGGVMPPLSGTLAKGSSRTQLRIETIFEWFSLVGGGTATVHAAVNGIPVQSGIFGGTQWETERCAASAFCLRTASFWLDLDAAEAANPGTFLGQPLTITVEGQSLGQPGDSYTASFTADVVKKK